MKRLHEPQHAGRGPLRAQARPATSSSIDKKDTNSLLHPAETATGHRRREVARCDTSAAGGPVSTFRRRAEGGKPWVHRGESNFTRMAMTAPEQAVFLCVCAAHYLLTSASEANFKILKIAQKHVSGALACVAAPLSSSLSCSAFMNCVYNLRVMLMRCRCLTCGRTADDHY